MGTGHIKRCLSLAQALAEAGAQTRFICRPLDAVAAQVLAAQNGTVHWLPAPTATFTPPADAPPHARWAGVSATDDAQQTAETLADWRPDWVVVDHYAFDARWHQTVRQTLDCRLLVIDDLADRPIAADALLDHNWDADHQAKYASQLQRAPVWLCGPRFALLSPVYQRASRYLFHEAVHSIGIFMGGTDPCGISTRVLAACRSVGFTGPVEVASTSASPHLPGLRQACTTDPDTTLTLDEPDLAAFFARHDLQIGAGGGATWERCCIGVPSVLVALAENQIPVLKAVDSLGLAIRSGISSGALADSVRKALTDSALRLRMSRTAVQLIDGKGAERVAFHLVQGT